MRAAIRILLLQARRPGDPCREEEVDSFARKAGLRGEQITPWDLLSAPPTLDRARKFDAVMIGGSGDFYVSKGHLPHQEETFDFLRQLVDAAHPTFASCFGFQCMVQALGGEIVHDPDNTEVGTYSLELTEEGVQDPLFGRLPESFQAQMGRKDRAGRLPEGVANLAKSDRCPYQAFRLGNRPIWASQFHPELDRDRNLGRFRNYLDGYAGAMSEQEREDAFARFGPSPETEDLLPAFLELVFSR